MEVEGDITSVLSDSEKQIESDGSSLESSSESDQCCDEEKEMNVLSQSRRESSTSEYEEEVKFPPKRKKKTKLRKERKREKQSEALAKMQRFMIRHGLVDPDTSQHDLQQMLDEDEEMSSEEDSG